MAQISPMESVSQATLDSLNVEQARNENRAKLDELGGVDALAKLIGVSFATGLTNEQVVHLREKHGTNKFPESPMSSFFELLLDALSDTTLLILIAAATVSLVLGITTGTAEEKKNGWIEGAAIFIAVFLVSNIAATNDYTKELQFRALEATSQEDERCSVLRNSIVERINPVDLVVGDILVLQAGDQIPADCIIVDHNKVLANEASLTGEPDDLKKSRDSDPFLLSSCLITEGEEVRAVVIGIGLHSQWGKIKANLVSESVNTPLQDKLEEMTKLIGYVGMGAAFGTFAALVISIWARDSGNNIVQGFVQAFILSVTIVVVAIPEGLPLAVTISLAYSTKKMYKDQCFIRVLAACETMGNATNICSDKTGTLTENRMTVVEGWFGDCRYTQESFPKAQIPETVLRTIVEQVCINRTAYLIMKDPEGKTLDRPQVIGNKTEGALIMMVKSWGFDYEAVKFSNFDDVRDRVYAFNSGKKRSTAVIHRPDGSVRIYCKGASEWIIKDCTMFMEREGRALPMTPAKRNEIEQLILNMADQALRTLVLAHKDYASEKDLPPDWEDSPPDNFDLCCDCIVGIIDPLREDVKEAVRIAQQAGVVVRMVTGDNVATASAIARQCGILTPNGLAVEGPNFRKMTPKEVDAILPRLQVMARSSPEDKFLLVTRLNGYGIPVTKEDWEAKHKDKGDVSWDKDRDRFLPGYREEWESTRPDGGQVVGVTGDGTNDAPALKAADVGLSMGITGTKVAQGASDIVILDDRFSSIVRAIMWGRAVYDNIRKFLQFQLTVNVVALTLVFIGAVAGFGEPLNAVQMLWVNLVMDTLGALALGTEAPLPSLLNRKPYKRTSGLISRPMWRFIFFQSTFQLILLFILMFSGSSIFQVQGKPLIQGIACSKYSIDHGTSTFTFPSTGTTITCNDFSKYCTSSSYQQYCLEDTHYINGTIPFKFDQLVNTQNGQLDYKGTCLSVCTLNDYTHGTIIFNAFIFCQIFNEFNSRRLFDEIDIFGGLLQNVTFLVVIFVSMGCQVFLVFVGGEFVKTTGLSAANFFITMAMGAMSLLVGFGCRFVPIVEDPDSFFVDSGAVKPNASA